MQVCHLFSSSLSAPSIKNFSFLSLFVLDFFLKHYVHFMSHAQCTQCIHLKYEAFQIMIRYMEHCIFGVEDKYMGVYIHSYRWYMYGSVYCQRLKFNLIYFITYIYTVENHYIYFQKLLKFFFVFIEKNIFKEKKRISLEISFMTYC